MACPSVVRGRIIIIMFLTPTLQQVQVCRECCTCLCTALLPVVQPVTIHMRNLVQSSCACQRTTSNDSVIAVFDALLDDGHDHIATIISEGLPEFTFCHWCPVYLLLVCMQAS
jgi:hypothetical protein